MLSNIHIIIASLCVGGISTEDLQCSHPAVNVLGEAAAKDASDEQTTMLLQVSSGSRLPRNQGTPEDAGETNDKSEDTDPADNIKLWSAFANWQVPDSSTGSADSAEVTATAAAFAMIKAWREQLDLQNLTEIDDSGLIKVNSEVRHLEVGLSIQAGNDSEAIQGLFFALICLGIVIGFYLLAFAASDDHTDTQDSAEHEMDKRGWCPCFPWKSRPFKAHMSPAEQLLSQRQRYQQFSMATSQGAAFQKGVFGVPQSSSRSLARYPPPSLPSMRPSLNRKVNDDDWHTELPMIYPSLVMPIAHTRLAVPLSPLSASLFEVDVLGLSGVPLLSAALVDNSGARSIQISLHSVSTLLAVVSSAKELFGADGTHFGTMVKEERVNESPQFALRDRAGRPILAVSSTRRDGRDFKMTSISNGRVVERATAVRRPPGKLPAEHYEVVANPNVDAVLVLACFLAVVVFEPTTSLAGRASVEHSAAPSLTGLYWGYKE